MPVTPVHRADTSSVPIGSTSELSELPANIRIHEGMPEDFGVQTPNRAS